MRNTVALVLLLGARTAGAVVLGGGLPSTDCTVAFEGVDATVGDSGVVCVDGDPSCDTDGVADGVCHFDVKLCTAVPSNDCVPAQITSIAVTGLPLEAPVVPSLGEACGAPVTVSVPVDTATGATVLARDMGDLKDVDYLNVCCRSASGPLDASTCALGVELAIAGCKTAPPRIAHAFARARADVKHAEEGSVHAARLLAHAERLLERARERARHLADREDCADALGLVIHHAEDTLGGP